MSKVLVGCPIHVSKDKDLDAYCKQLMNIEHPNFDILLVDNSPDKNHARNVQRKYGIECLWCDPQGKNVFELMTESLNRLRTRVLYGNYSHFFSVEEDIEIGRDTLNWLLSFEADCISIPYFIGVGAESRLCLVDIEDFEQAPLNNLLEYSESFLRMNGKVIQADGVGLGCCLISRGVLQRIKFRQHPMRNLPPDTFFSLEMKMYGIPSLLDTSHILKHNNQKWNLKMN